jgi:hypothetical protein
MESQPLRQLDTTYLEQPPFLSSTPLPAGWDLSEFLNAASQNGVQTEPGHAPLLGMRQSGATEAQPTPQPSCEAFHQVRTLPHHWDLSEFA